MSWSRLWLVVGVLLTLSGCAFLEALLEVEPRTVYPAVVGGNRAAGMVTVVYDTYTENVQFDEVQVYHSVKGRCAGWGYTEASPFDVWQWNCIEWDETGDCDMWRVSLNWQCLGGPGQ